MNTNFGDFIKARRLELDLSLRKFCENLSLDPSNWSKIERNKLQLTYEKEKLEEIAQLLKFEKGSKKWTELFDLATVAKRNIPDYVYNDEEILNALPIFFRTASNEKPTTAELDKLIELLKKR